jgi:hypothetical protein
MRRRYQRRGNKVEEVVEVRGPKAAEDALLRLFGQPKQGDKAH